MELVGKEWFGCSNYSCFEIYFVCLFNGFFWCYDIIFFVFDFWILVFFGGWVFFLGFFDELNYGDFKVFFVGKIFWVVSLE